MTTTQPKREEQDIQAIQRLYDDIIVVMRQSDLSEFKKKMEHVANQDLLIKQLKDLRQDPVTLILQRLSGCLRGPKARLTLGALIAPD